MNDVRLAASILKAGYDLDAAEGPWLLKLADTLQPFLPGEGILAYYYDSQQAPRRWLEHAQVLGSAVTLRFYEEVEQATPVEMQHALHFRPPMYKTASSIVPGGASLPLPPQFLAYGFSDVLGLTTAGVDGKGLAFVTPMRRRIEPTPLRQRLLDCVSVHLAAGLRLRQALLSSGASRGAVEAIVSPGGEVLDAQGPARSVTARDALRRATIRRERARLAARQGADVTSIEMWDALAGGRWSLLDSFESDGRRYLVARRNDPEVEPRLPLTTRERQIAQLAAYGHPDKLIAYQLGISASTVATHLGRLLRKLGLKSRLDLVVFFSQRSGQLSG